MQLTTTPQESPAGATLFPHSAFSWVTFLVGSTAMFQLWCSVNWGLRPRFSRVVFAATCPAAALHVFFTSVASGMCPKPCSSFGFQAMCQQWPFEFIWIPDQCPPRCCWPLRFPIWVQLSLLRARRPASQTLSFVLLTAASTHLEVCDLGEPWHSFFIAVFPVGCLARFQSLQRARNTALAATCLFSGRFLALCFTL